MWRVVWSERVEKQLERIPDYIEIKFRAWAQGIEEKGLLAVRKIPGFHDEPLQGKRFGQRSVRLNRSYRAIYIECPGDEVELIEVIEVNKHDYKK